MFKKSLLLTLLLALLVPWAANAQNTLPLYETGTATSEYVPFYGWYGDAVQTDQMIYPADQLTAMVGASISQMVFFWDSQYGSNTLCNWVVKMGTTTATTLSGIDNTTALTQVYSGAMSFDNTEKTMTIVFDNAFVYSGGNLLIQFTNPVTNSSAYHKYDFLGVEATGASYCYSAQRNFLPRVTFTYEGLTEPWISLNPSAATVFTGFTQDITASYGNVTGTPTITYTTSNNKVATVSGSGTSATITGVSAGTATITATMTYNATEYTATCAVTVEDPSYCTPTFGDPSDDYIANFATTGGATNIDNTTTYETGGYSNYYEAVSASIQAGETLSCTVTPSSTSFAYGHAIWVDWNKNYEFENSERVAYSTSAAAGNWTGEFEVPSTTAAGDYRLRVIHLYNNNVTDPCHSATYGEGEDYKLTVLAGNPYQKPTDLTVTDLGPFNATIGWTAPSTEVVNYQYQYMPDGGDWTTLTTTTALNAPLTGLTDETDYTFRVKAIYAGGESDFATTAFTTEVACETPTSFNVTAEATSAQITWEGTATTYNLRYRQIEPVTVTLTAGDVWGDGSGYQMLLDADATAYGIADYSIFEYKIPVDADNDTYTTHVVFENSITIHIPGGTYDWFITNPSPGDQVYIAGSNGNVGGRQDDYVFEGGKTYEFVPSIYGSGDGVDVTITGEAVTPGAWTTVNGISGKSYTIPTLDPSSFYEVQVQAVCGGIYGESDWVSEFFQTPASCLAPENLAVDPTSITAYGATFTWTAEATDEFQYCYVKDPTPGYTPTESEFTNSATGGTITITHDFDPDSDYRFYLRRNCGGGEYSSIVSVAFHTDLSCYPPTDVTVDDSDITATTAIIEWTSSADNFDLKYSALHDGTEYKYDNGTATSAFKNCYGGVMFPAGEFTNDHIQKVTLFDYGTSVATGELYIYNGGTTEPEDLVYYSEIKFEGTNDFADYFVDAAIDNTKNVWVVVHFATSENVWKIPVCDNTGDANGRWFSTDGTTWADLVDVTSYDYTWMIRATVDNASDYTWFNKTSTETTYPINALTPSTNYVAQVRTNCGIEDGVSTWVTTLFTTMDLCPEPQNLTVSDETPHGATFSWTDGGSETEWHLYFSKENTAPADDIDLSKVTVANSNPFTMTTGLDPETDYYVWVRANCGSTDGYSMWVGPKTFTTGIACPAPTGLAYSEVTNHTAKLSWTGTSESYNVRYRTAAIATTTKLFFDGFEDYDDEDALEAIWTVNNPNPGETVGLSTSAAKTGTKGFQFSSYNGASANQYLISPLLTVSGVLEFAYKRTSGNETFRVGYSTTTDDIDQFGNWETFTASSSTWVTYSKEIPTDAKYFAINYTSSNKWYLYIDDITIYETVPAGAWQAVDPAPDASPCTISDLSAETKYEVQVQGNCGGEGLSQWSASVLFTTNIACPAPTGLTASNPTSTSFDLQWTNGGSEDWVLAYKVDGAADFTEMDLNVSDVTEEAGTISYTLSGLDPETDYIVKVRDNCEASYVGDGMSEWTAEVPYSTIAACSAMNPVVNPASITHHNATVTWDGESTSGFNVNYREAAYIDGIPEEFSSSSAPEGWTRYSGEWNSDGTGPTSTTTSGWSFGAKNFTNSHAYMNMYSDWKYWLVTPSITVGSNYEMNFDAAYTKYNATTTPDQTGTDDRFVILISTDNKAHWTSLREWNNAGTGDAVLNDLPVTFQPVDPIDLSAFNGQTVYIAFYGASTESNTDNHLRIDNVVIGVNVPAATTWQTQAATTTTADLTGLTAGTKYDVKVVPNCDATLESTTVQFTTMSANEKQFITAGDWATATNWLDGEMPTIADNAVIKANATINNGTVATANNISFQGSPTPTLTIENGAQLKHNNTSSINATVKKTITGYGTANANTNNGYVLFAPPFGQYIYTNNSDGTGLRNGTYDLYTWGRTNDQEWTNYGSSNNNSLYMSRGTGYLYASQDTRDITFTGYIYGSGAKYSKSVSYNAPGTGTEFSDWNLIGNPFVCDAYLATEDGKTLLAYYKMNDDGNSFTAVSNGAAIASMQGIFYQATAAGNVYFFRELPSASVMPGNLNINVAQVVNSRDAHRSTDNAIIRFGEGNTLEKFSFNANNAKVYIPQDGKDYAVVNAANEGEMPVYFKAAENGNYSISFNAENVEFSYLHLIDNLTGNEVNLLETPSYSFDARTIDYASRFKLVFVTGQANMGDDFGFFDANGNLMILGIEGTATLQMIDVTGRIISSETFSGNYSKAINAKAGVYMLRLIQGNDVRTQKIVVR